MSTNVNYKRIETAIRFLKENVHKQPSLEETAAHVHLSPFHFQREFTEWAGISPKKFLQYITLEELKKGLLQSPNLIAAAQQAGLSSQSRVYDLFVNIESVTPQEYKTQGKGIDIEYGIHQTPFGNCFIAQTARGICFMSFVDDDNNDIDALEQMWPNAIITQHQENTFHTVTSVFYPSGKKPLQLFVKGTAFQIKVWEALLKIPFGTVSSYRHIASSLGNAGAMRAVGTAVGSNPVAYLIPCHRVIRSEGIIGQYHWGSDRKTAMIGWEKGKTENTEV
jgi:AraC family transcriptional regulator, regulatory protein of adaptative response / methylated-DNA-[protein]-cysteine methyltransferase